MTAKAHSKQTYQRGLYAELLAMALLTLKGYRILKHRYKTPVGEIDIVAKKKDMLIFVEVKARKTKRAALESITSKMQHRITKAAAYYLATHKIDNAPCRFDLVTVNGFCRCDHLDNIW